MSKCAWTTAQTAAFLELERLSGELGNYPPISHSFARLPACAQSKIGGLRAILRQLLVARRRIQRPTATIAHKPSTAAKGHA